MERQMIQQYVEKCSKVENEKFNKVNNEVNEINDTGDKSTRQKQLKNQKNGKKRHHSSSTNKLLVKVNKILCYSSQMIVILQIKLLIFVFLIYFLRFLR